MNDKRAACKNSEPELLCNYRGGLRRVRAHMGEVPSLAGSKTNTFSVRKTTPYTVYCVLMLYTAGQKSVPERVDGLVVQYCHTVLYESIPYKSVSPCCTAPRLHQPQNIAPLICLVFQIAPPSQSWPAESIGRLASFLVPPFPRKRRQVKAGCLFHDSLVNRS